MVFMNESVVIASRNTGSFATAMPRPTGAPALREPPLPLFVRQSEVASFQRSEPPSAVPTTRAHFSHFAQTGLNIAVPFLKSSLRWFGRFGDSTRTPN
jgi:hypothetical protein